MFKDLLPRCIGACKSLVLLLVMATTSMGPLMAQSVTYPAGAFIVNMGVVPQTAANALKPYGMIYDLITNYGVPISWIIEPAKVKDGIDFSYAGVDYRGGPFIIPAIYRTAAVNTQITYWQGQGVVGVTTTSPVTVPLFKTLTVSSAPRWTLDKQNGSIALDFFINAGIPPAAYGGNSSSNWKNPNELACCDDIFVMPHADPIWATHSFLLTWNQTCKGNIWTGCHAGSALELMFNPSNPSVQTNFLSEKTGTAAGSGPYASPNNTLIIWGSHSNGTPPYSYSNHGDPIMQFLGLIDAGTQNGSEQIFIPVNGVGAGWRTSTVTGVFDPDHLQRASDDEKDRAAVLAYGRAFGDSDRGYIMMQAGHDIAKASAPPNIAAQRAFFNFSFQAAKLKEPDPEVTLDLSAVFSGTDNVLSFTLQGDRSISEFTSILWESSCGGSFDPVNTQNTLFTAPVVGVPTSCVITISLTDTCGRIYKSSTGFTVQCGITVSSSVVNPCYTTPNSGSIAMGITGASGPFIWDWSRSGGGTGSGSGTSITGLSAGTYTVTVTSNNGAGCSAVFSTTLTLSPEIVITTTPSPVLCNGGLTGGVSTSVTGGIPGYSYSWTGPGGFTSSAQNLSVLATGTYDLTVTDSKGCTETDAVVVTQPDAIVITPTVTHVTCFGAGNGQISIGVSGGTSPYTYLWNDGNATQNRTGLATGSYSVTVTDDNGCTETYSSMTVTQPAAALSVSETHVNILCYGNSTGSIDITASNGTSPYTYSWTGPGAYTSTSEDPTGLAAGNYSVTVSDANNCTVVKQVTLTHPTAISLSTVVTNPTCPPGASPPVNSDGEIDLSPSGGAGSYTYSWTASNGGIVPPAQASAQDLTDLVAGTYTVVVTDANSCTASTSVTLINLNPDPVQPGVIQH